MPNDVPTPTREKARQVVVHTDGAARGNPGPAGIGAVIEMPVGHVVRRIARSIGVRTNNQAEYEAVIAGLRAAQELQAQQVTLMLDSQLVARQLRGVYKVRDAELKKLFETASTLMKSFKRLAVMHVPRARNAAADRLANEGIDGNITV